LRAGHRLTPPHPPHPQDCTCGNFSNYNDALAAILIHHRGHRRF
jgi:hypothetical protein